MCNWMNNPAFMAYAFECDQREKEDKLKRQKRTDNWPDAMNEEEDDDDDEDGW